MDVPERKQPFGTTAKQAQSDLAFRNHAQVVEVDKERYRRIVGRVYVDGLDVNAVLKRHAGPTARRGRRS